MNVWTECSILTLKHKFIQLFGILGTVYVTSYQWGTPQLQLLERVNEEATRLKDSVHIKIIGLKSVS